VHVVRLASRGELPPPEAGSDSNNLAKGASEVSLIAHSAIDSDPCKRFSRFKHHDLRATHALSSDIDEGSLAKALLK
jgi:hypothetical protein